MIKALIVEDEYPARTLLRRLLGKYDWIELIGEADNGKKAIDLLEQHKPQLVFLDIHLPDMKGFDILKTIAYQPMIIFTTAYEQYAIDAFESLAIDYLVKPLAQDRMDQAISKLHKIILSNSAISYTNADVHKIAESYGVRKHLKYLTSKVGHKIELVDIDTISHIVAEDKYASIYTIDGASYFTEKTLQSIEQKLPQNFIRIHRSHIINKDKIDVIQKHIKGRYMIFMLDKARSAFNTSDSYKEVFRAAMGL